MMVSRYFKPGLLGGIAAFGLLLLLHTMHNPSISFMGKQYKDVDAPNQLNRRINSLNLGFQESTSAKVAESITTETGIPSSDISKFDLFLVKYKECIFKEPKETFWPLLMNIVNKCQHKMTAFNESLFTVHVGRYHETKVYMEFSNKDEKRSEYSNSCKMLTVGIGGDILAEQEIVARYPKCRLWGMDPKQMEGWEFITVGTYVPFGLTVGGGLLNLTVRKPDKSYGVEKVPTISMEQLAERYTGPITIHFAVIDIEGGEYSILPEFESGGAFDRSPLTFCQIDIEFHGPLIEMSVKSSRGFYSFFRKFIENGPFIPIYGKSHLNMHRKITVLNIKNENCRNMFDIKENVKY